ncbi:MAG: glyceraldehyde-3-phosphate dehydrogenase, type I [Haloquadratum walsbyi J07HQW1]|jgi:glyceraldehyde 3-phosphate dehydrogenase|uniref:glyceraldehyde-3-phosphate dehydrogenase (NAD(P)(+)) (phosphorylating) n=1 Tax=Haloquadratum walsbyi J07HQW1 TaxID=1238424 RepID=U1PET2_9EURY|nr:MAG: glyceraldehyde-3-phosphate dehydrogenase, type I [Haloquadratum walsbyi J07HQW1]
MSAVGTYGFKYVYEVYSHMSEKSNLSADSSHDAIRVGLNGFGRIGRSVLRAIIDNPSIELVGINDVMEFDDMGYLAKYDTVMGRADGISQDGNVLTVGETTVPLYNIQDPTELPWDQLNVDVTLECTGIFRTRSDAAAHLEAGADKVIISAPPKGDEPVKQIVYGVNHHEYAGEDILSNASCTTNSVSPVAKVLDDEFGIESGLLTTVHAYTGSQALIDSPMTKTRRGRAAAENIVPTSTGAAQATTEILPQLEGKLDGMAMRVPVPNGSITELVVNLSTGPSIKNVNDAFRDAADDGPLAGVLGYTDDEVVSSDIIGLPFSSMVDLHSTNQVNAGGLYKILTWYDNEFGFSNRMLDLAQFIMGSDTDTTTTA